MQQPRSHFFSALDLPFFSTIAHFHVGKFHSLVVVVVAVVVVVVVVVIPTLLCYCINNVDRAALPCTTVLLLWPSHTQSNPLILKSFPLSLLVASPIFVLFKAHLTLTEQLGNSLIKSFAVH